MSHQPQPLSDAELKQHIADCGRHLLKAHAEGDEAQARVWLSEQAEAIKSRSPAQVKRMEACYFAADGLRARMTAEARRVA